MCLKKLAMGVLNFKLNFTNKKLLENSREKHFQN